MSLLCDIDTVRERGETWTVDPEMREALDRLGADLRSEMQTLGRDLRADIRTSAEESRAHVDASIRASAAETRNYIDERHHTTTANLLHEIRESESRMRRHFKVIGESLRGEIRGVAELVALSNEASKRRDDEQTGRTDGLEGRVLRLEVRVSNLEDARKLRRPRRRP